ncbi:UNVERIFIED_CONTAM: hypothetical protein Slati_2421600 [Sesamum latifolium]|uniref:Reverse transcriptase Ty1/copia-type domain-containing protein n=1 Tax=Sesamum latifolium TaxID=2727402 RepID=A0AAW2WDQ4_9LAMI
MLSLVKKLEDLQAGLDNDTYIDVILQSLPPSYDPFVVNYNMNGLEKSINELINMLVQYEATTKKSEPSVLVGEASTSKAKGKGAKRWKRKKGKANATASALSAPVAPVRMGRDKGKVGLKPIRTNNVCAGKKQKLSRDEVVLKLGDGKAVAAEAVGIVHLVVSDQVMIELKDCYYVPSMIKNIISISLLDNPANLLKGKMTKKPFVGQSTLASGLLDLIHSDVYGPLNTQARGYALETEAKLLNMAPSKTVDQTPYHIWHGKLASYKYLRVWGSPAYVKRLVGDKLDSRSSLCRSTRVSQQPKRYGFMGFTGQLDNDPKIYGEAMSDIDSKKWIEAMKFEMDSMSSNKVWTLVDPLKSVKPVGCKWVYKRKLRVDGEVTTFKARLVAKGYTQKPVIDFEETYSPSHGQVHSDYACHSCMV